MFTAFEGLYDDHDPGPMSSYDQPPSSQHYPHNTGPFNYETGDPPTSLPPGDYLGPQASYYQALPSDSYSDSGLTQRYDQTQSDSVRVALQQNLNDTNTQTEYQQSPFYYSSGSQRRNHVSPKLSRRKLKSPDNDNKGEVSHPSDQVNYGGHCEAFSLEDSPEYVTNANKTCNRCIGRRGRTNLNECKENKKNGASKKSGRKCGHLEGFMEEDKAY